jgi:hypothetical protein
MLIAAVIDNHDLNERDRAAPFQLLGSAVSVDRSHVFDHILLGHYVEVFHLLPEVLRAQNTPRYTGGAN